MNLYRLSAGIVSRLPAGIATGNLSPRIQDLSVAPNGDLYILVNDGFGKIYRYPNASGPPELVAGGGSRNTDGPALSAQLGPSRIVAAHDGVYIVESPSVRKIANGQIVTLVTGNVFAAPELPVLHGPYDIEVDATGNLFITDVERLFKRTPDGTLVAIAGGGGDWSTENIPGTSAKIATLSIAADGNGNVYMQDQGRIRRLDAQTGLIRTIAGKYEMGFSGDNDPASDAMFDALLSIDVAADGTIYAADPLNLRIRKIASGAVTTIAGGNSIGDGGQATAAQLFSPSGLAFDSSGNLYIADAENNRIRKVAIASGIITTTAGDGLPWKADRPSPGRFRFPDAVGFDANDNLYVRDSFHIRKLVSGNMTVIAGAGSFTGDVPLSIPATSLNIANVNNIAVAPDGEVYFGDRWRDALFRLAQDGMAYRVTANTFPNAYVVLQGGALVVASLDSVVKINLASGVATPIGPRIFCHAIAVDPSGNIYLSAGQTVLKIDALTSQLTTVAGGGSADEPGDGSAAGDIRFFDIRGLAADNLGNLYVADSFTNRVWRLSPALEVTTAALPSGSMGKAYSTFLEASGGTPPYRWTTTGLIQPMVLDPATGELRGVPSLPGLYQLNVTVTDAAGRKATRQFTLPVQESWPSDLSVTPQSGSGIEQAFTVKAVNASSAAPLLVVRIFVGSAPGDPSGGCMIEYVKAQRYFKIAAPDGKSWIPPSVSPVLSNGLCSLDTSASFGTTVPAGGSESTTVRYSIRFAKEYSGPKNIYLLAAGDQGATSGWIASGTWTVSAPAVSEPRVVSLQPAIGAGTTQTFTGVFTHSAGASELYLGYILLLPTPNVVQYTAAGSCLVEYNRISNAMRLINEAGNNWLGPVSGVPLSQGGTLSNSRCTLNIGSSSAQLTGSTLTVNASITLSPSFGGVLGTFLQSADIHDVWTGMTQFGNWTGTALTAAKAGPYVGEMRLSASTGTATTISLTAGHTSGVSQLSMVHVRINSAVVGGAPCHVVYFPASDTFNLINDAETAMVSPTGVRPGAAALSNGRCTLGTSSARTMAGNDLTLTLPFVFPSSFTGAKNIYVNAFDNRGNLTHWIQTGTYSVQ
jgi:sugar lactone lactonase YvrE